MEFSLEVFALAFNPVKAGLRLGMILHSLIGVRLLVACSLYCRGIGAGNDNLHLLSEHLALPAIGCPFLAAGVVVAVPTGLIQFIPSSIIPFGVVRRRLSLEPGT